MKRIAIPIFLFCAVVSVPLSEGRIWEERYRDADQYTGEYSDGYVAGDVNPQWIKGGHSFWFRKPLETGYEFVLVEPDAASMKAAFDHQNLSAKLGKLLGKELDAARLPFDHIKFTQDKASFSFETEGRLFRYAIATGELSEEKRKVDPSAQSDAPFDGFVSPDGKYKAFIREYNLHIRDLKSGEITRLSSDGSEGEPYSVIVAWSPNSDRLICCKETKVPQRMLTLIESSPKDQVQPVVKSVPYRKPGDALPIKRPVVFTTQPDSGRVVSFPEPERQYSLSAPRWSRDGSYFTFEYNKRGHSEYIVYRADKDGGNVAAAVAERSPTFVHYPRNYRYDLEKSGEIIWVSERDGWRHLYLLDAQTGEVKRPITSGEWIVKSVLNVDEDGRTIRFIGCGKDGGEDPYLEKLYMVSIDGGEPVCLTPENAWHQVSLSPDGQVFVDYMSRVDMPGGSVLRETATGKVMMTLLESDTRKAVEKGWRMPEVFCAKGRDGETDIWGVIIRPDDFEEGKKYPVIETIYAGPHDSHVPKQFRLRYGNGKWTELGFIVVMIDGMGTANRSKKFHDVCWKNLKDAGFPDRIAWMKAAAAKYPEMDVSRVGIEGVSAGGQNAMSAVIFHPEFYKAAVAACGCHDNRMDKIWWNELWMGYPIGRQYEENSNVVNAHKLQGELMLILGELDSNVDPSSTTQVVDALIKADKEFEFVLVPGEGHSGGGAYGERKKRNFFIRHLMGEIPPASNRNK